MNTDTHAPQTTPAEAAAHIDAAITALAGAYEALWTLPDAPMDDHAIAELYATARKLAAMRADVAAMPARS